jgi:hypothetical protein
MIETEDGYFSVYNVFDENKENQHKNFKDLFAIFQQKSDSISYLIIGFSIFYEVSTQKNI